MALSANEHASDQVRAIPALKLQQLRDWLATGQSAPKDEEERAHLFAAMSQVVQFQKDPKQISTAAPAEPPDGPPIGTDDDWDGWH